MTNESDKFAAARKKMVTRDLKGRGIMDQAVLEAMNHVPRHQFVLEKYQSQAYEDSPLPIGMGQTISQPYIVALMTELLRVDKNCDVFELGTGCGYQTAVLSWLAKKVYTIEKLNQLSEYAQRHLEKINVNNVEFCIGDGSKGWPGKIQFDRVIITAAVPQIPKPVLDQLKTGGIIVAPVGSKSAQRLIVCEKKPVGTTQRSVCDVRFVPLIGEYAFDE